MTGSRSCSARSMRRRTSISWHESSPSYPTGKSSSAAVSVTRIASAPEHADAIIVGGFVDDGMRAVLYSAADLVVLSYQPTFERDSDGLMDAVSWGVPVVCSDGSAAADAVRGYNLGTIFEPGNPDSLERAVEHAPARVDAADLEPRPHGALQPHGRGAVLGRAPANSAGRRRSNLTTRQAATTTGSS